MIQALNATVDCGATVTAALVRLGSLVARVDGHAGAAPAPLRVRRLYQGRPLWPFGTDWSNQPAQTFSYDLRETWLGTHSPRFEQLQQHVTRGFEFSLWREEEEQRQEFDTWTGELQGRIAGFWIAAPLAPAEILDGGTSTTFLIADQALRETYADHPARHLIFTPPAGSGVPVQFGRISSVALDSAGVERVTLEEPLEPAVDETWLAQRLLYVRLASDEETADLETDALQRRRVRVVELPTEYAGIETGQQPVFLYEFWVDGGGTPARWRFTSLNETVASGGYAFTPAPFEHGQLTFSARPVSEEVQLTSWFEPANPISQFLPFQISQPLWVKIRETTFAAPDTTTLLFTGKVQSVEPEGKLLKAKCVSIIDALGRRLPRMLIQPRCNYAVYSAPCKLAKADFVANVSFTVAAGRVQTMTLTDSENNFFTEAEANDFALGWLETGSGATREIRTIRQSSVATGGKMTLTLNEEFHHTTGMTTAKIYLGCDGSAARCTNKFQNFANWGGHVTAPANLTVAAIPSDTVSGNKK